MKKLVLVMVCTLVMTIFIAFNYVLWDREKKIQDFEDIEITKNASINALARENKLLDDSNKQLKNNVDDLKGMVSQQQTSNEQLRQESLKAVQELSLKSALVKKLAMMADLKPIEVIVKKWAENIEKGQYEEAFKMLRNDTFNAGHPLTLDEFVRSYKGTVKFIRIKSVKLNMEKAGGGNTGDLVFNVVMDVKLLDNAGKSEYIDGVNEKYFGLVYDKASDSWLIGSIFKE